MSRAHLSTSEHTMPGFTTESAASCAWSTVSYTFFCSDSTTSPIWIVRVISEQYPWYIQPKSIVRKSPSVSSFGCGIACGRLLFEPLAAIVSKLVPSAPRSRISYSNCKATRCSVNPSFQFSWINFTISVNASSPICSARASFAISSSVFTSRYTLTASSSGTNSTCIPVNSFANVSTKAWYCIYEISLFSNPIRSVDLPSFANAFCTIAAIVLEYPSRPISTQVNSGASSSTCSVYRLSVKIYCSPWNATSIPVCPRYPDRWWMLYPSVRISTCKSFLSITCTSCSFMSIKPPTVVVYNHRFGNTTQKCNK